MRRLVPALGILSVSTAVLMAGELFPYHRRAIVRCAPPQIQYVHHNPSNPVTKATFTGNLLPVTVNPSVAQTTGQPATLPGPSATIKYWQLSESEIRSEHCSISNATLWIDDYTGEWRLSFTSTQNPFVGPANQALPAARFLRNKFFVMVRAVGAQPVVSNAATNPLTGPEMFCIEIPPFWIDRSETRPVSYKGQLSELDRSRIKYVDRLLIDFSFE
ncbi:MAG: hypothetical protein U0941_31125 [Planctomycetaceae bacterium]